MLPSPLPQVRAEGPRLGLALCEMALPRPWWLGIFPLAAAARALLYWITTFTAEPELPLAVRVIFRPGGDTQYLPLVAAASRLNFGEPALLESYGTGWGAFPYASVAVHALCYRLFGVAGFVVADVLAALAYFVVLGAFLRLVGVPRRWAAVAAGLVATDALTWLWKQLIGAVGVLPNATTPLYWGSRLPRPLVSETLALLVAALAVRLVRTPPGAISVRAWAGAGAAMALLLQADFHGSVTFGILLAIVLAVCLVERRLIDRTALRVLGAFALSLVVVGCPFLLQQLLAHPDLPRRLGVYAVSRAHPLHELGPELPRLWNLLAATALACLVVAHFEREERRVVPGLLVAAGASVLALFALPLSCVLLGKSIQPAHFVDRWWRLSAYALLAAGLWLLRGVLVLVRARLGGRRTAERVAGPAAAVALFLIARQLWQQYPVPLEGGAPRRDFARYANIADYKTHFAELCRELASQRHARARTLATLDHHVYVYWTTFARGYAQVPDPFSSSAPDAELEDRLLGLFHLLGVTPEELPAALSEPSTLVFFLSHDKYQATGAHHFGPLAEYPAGVQAYIRTTSFNSCWNLAVPRSEQERLARRYEELRKGPPPSPDLVVLEAAEVSAGHRPPAERYRLHYRNDAFELWTRR